jgi:hypothetical protein
MNSRQGKLAMKIKYFKWGLGRKITRRDFIHDAGLASMVLTLPIGTVACTGAERTYTLAEKNIQHAKENLPRQIVTQDSKFTEQVHNLYTDCLFDKLWEPALPGLPYKWFSITGADDTGYGKCQLQWDTMFILNAWAPLDDDELVRDVFRNYWNVIDNNPEAPQGSYRYGMVPCVTNPDLPQMGFAQIPILAWGCLNIFNQTNDRALLDLCLPYLDAYLTWYATERDVDNDGLIEYGAYKRISIGDMVQTAKFETFDFHATLDDLELTKHPTRGTGGEWYGNIEGAEQTCFLAISERAMIEMCQVTGRLEMKQKYERRLTKRTEAFRTKMWDHEVLLQSQQRYRRKDPRSNAPGFHGSDCWPGKRGTSGRAGQTADGPIAILESVSGYNHSDE